MDHVLSFLAAMIAVANPVFHLPIWLDATAGDRPGVRWRLATWVCGTALVVLVAALLFGRATLSFFEIDLLSFRIGGGIILLVLGLQMLQGSALKVTTEDEPDLRPGTAAKRQFQRIATPLAVPLLAGPGTITTAILYGARAQDMTQRLPLVLPIVVVVCVIYLLLLFGHHISRLTGITLLRMLPRIFSIVLVAIGIQFTLEGLAEAFPAWGDGHSPVESEKIQI